jgi:heme exporter protein C
MAINWFRYASPATFYPLAGKLAPWFAWASAVLAATGLYVGLVVAPRIFSRVTPTGSSSSTCPRRG